MKLNILSTKLFRYLNIFIIVVVFTLFSNIFIVPEAQAWGIRPSPPPESTPKNGQNQSIEGLFDIIKFSDNTTPDIKLVGSFTVNGRDLKKQPLSVIGNGNLLNVVRAAAEVWVQAFPQADILEDMNIGVAWADFEINQDLLKCVSEKVAISPNGLELDGIVATYIQPGDNYINIENFFPNTDLNGVIVFNSQLLEVDLDGDNDKEHIWLYLDKDPFNSKVFGKLNPEKVRYLGDSQGNEINFGRSIFRSPSDFNSVISSGSGKFPIFIRRGNRKVELVEPDDLVIDVFSVALHELQHALGLSTYNSLALSPKILIDKQPKYSPSRLFISPGVLIPSTVTDNWRDSLINGVSIFPGSLHIFDNLDQSFDDEYVSPKSREIGGITATIVGQQIATPVGFEFVTNSERKCPSEADIRAIAEINGNEFKFFNTDPCKTFAEIPNDLQ